VDIWCRLFRAEPRNRATAQPRNRATAQPRNRATAQPRNSAGKCFISSLPDFSRNWQASLSHPQPSTMNTQLTFQWSDVVIIPVAG
jgi:hypothetical protein